MVASNSGRGNRPSGGGNRLFGFTDLYAGWHESRARDAGSDDAEWSGAVGRIAYDRCSSVEDQLSWLRQAGFLETDCLFKEYRFAVLVARRRPTHSNAVGARGVGRDWLQLLWQAVENLAGGPSRCGSATLMQIDTLPYGSSSPPIGRPVRRRRWRYLAVPVIVLVGLGLGLRKDVTYYKITSGSMQPTFQVGQRVAVNPHSGPPAVGETVALHAPQGAVPATPVCGAGGQGAGFTQACDAATPQESHTVFVKRIVAGPGDLISIVNGHAVRNGTAEPEPYAAPCGAGSTCNFPTPVRVPAGDYFVLGDNRGVSDDSRFWGPVPRAWIIGPVVRCSFLEISCQPVR